MWQRVFQEDSLCTSLMCGVFRELWGSSVAEVCKGWGVQGMGDEAARGDTIRSAGSTVLGSLDFIPKAGESSGMA